MKVFLAVCLVASWFLGILVGYSLVEVAEPPPTEVVDTTALELMALQHAHERQVEEFRANLNAYLIGQVREMVDAVLLALEGEGSLQRLNRGSK